MNHMWWRIRYYTKFIFHMIGINARVFYGTWKLTRLPQPAITVFGGSRIARDNPYSTLACETAKKLAHEGFSIITGGGPGIMEAANMGAYEYAKGAITERCKKVRGNFCHHPSCKRKFISIGIGVTGLNIEKINRYVHDLITMDHFFTRKWLLVRYSVGFVVFPGGFGTMDELFEIITLIQNNRMTHTPILLMGREFWQPLMTWIKEYLLKNKLISQKDFELISIVDDPDQALTIIKKECSSC